MHRRRYLIRNLIFVFFFLANPAYFLACEEDDDHFTFGEEEMVALLDTVNGAAWEIDEYKIVFSLSQEGEALARNRMSRPELTATAQACGTRTFVKSAEACIDLSEMPVVGETSVYRAVENGDWQLIDTIPTEGYLDVEGLNLTNARVELTLDGGFAYLSWSENDGDAFQLLSLTVEDVGDDAAVISYEQGY